MTVRTNRVDKSEFYGCVRFPACRETLPIEYDQKPVQAVLASMGIDNARDKNKDNKPKNPVMCSSERAKLACKTKPKDLLYGYLGFRGSFHFIFHYPNVTPIYPIYTYI